MPPHMFACSIRFIHRRLGLLTYRNSTEVGPFLPSEYVYLLTNHGFLKECFNNVHFCPPFSHSFVCKAVDEEWNIF